MARKKIRPGSSKTAAIAKAVGPQLLESHFFNFGNFVKLSRVSENLKYKMGVFSISLPSVHNFVNVDVIHLHFKANSSECFLWWEERNDGNEKQVKFSPATCEVPFDVLKSFSFQRQFDLKLDSTTLQCASLDVNVYINPKLVVQLKYASEPYLNRFRTYVQTVVKYYYGISTEVYENDFIDEEDHIEKIYKCINNSYNPSEKVGKLSHRFLIPELREYQKQAVCWMLKCETHLGESIGNEIDDHILYSEINLPDGCKLYYHTFGGFFVPEKLASQPFCKGGILADEMGLGKTIEVLACILLHPRKDLKVVKEKVSHFEKDHIVAENQTSENVTHATTVKRKKKLDENKWITIKNRRKKRNCSNVNEEFQVKCRKCGLVQDIEPGNPSDLLDCPLCSDDPLKFSSDEDGDSVSSDDISEEEQEFLSMEVDKQHGHFECICGFNGKRKRRKLVQCTNCGLQQHAECVLAEPQTSFVDYMCPYCWVEPSIVPVQSRATLIVSPSSILHQWESEITKHVKGKKLKVFIYNGVDHHKFINPKSLADNDIVISSYEIFRKELSHVDVPHGEHQRILRYQKRFRTLPSPLSAVEWWRICLDEAQMVEGVTTKTAQMALQLKCINRWCVTGTPIQNSVEDLYGLFLFLGYDPYDEKLWWKELLWKPFANDRTDALSCVLNNVLWRTLKDHVSDQIGIPSQKVIVHKVLLSAIEKAFYDSLCTRCTRDFMENVRKYDCEGIRLQNMDKRVLSKILLPMKNLQKACCHFQLAENKFSNVQKNTMTIPELLDHLLKNTSYECEELHRKMILALNGSAGIFTIKKEHKNACETYKKVLIAVEENKKIIRTDILQQIHTLFNYSEAISLWMEKTDEFPEIKETLKCEDICAFKEEIKKKSEELSNTYLEKFISVTQNCKDILNQDKKEISQIKLQFKCQAKTSAFSKWWLGIFEFLGAEEKKSFVTRIKESLLDAPGRSFLPGSMSISDSFQTTVGLSCRLVTLSDELHKTRSSLVDAVNGIISVPSADVLHGAIECHLRPVPGQKVSKCSYCKVDDIFSLYESKLFRFNDTISNDDSTDTENVCLPHLRKGTYADSEFELVLKIFVNFARHRKDLTVFAEDGNAELKLFDAMKKEFKHLRSTWIKMCEYVSAIDELEMAKMSLRLLLPGEEPPNPPVPYIILPSKLQSTLMQFQSDVICNQNEFKKKLGQLFYLQNLKKAENAEGPFEESCPVCHQSIDKMWSVLQCGHSFCVPCVEMLVGSSARSAFRCPVCRELTPVSDVYCIDRTPKPEDNIKGKYSTKISAVVKCLLGIKQEDPSAKSLVFTSWTDLLIILEQALTENDLSFVSLANKRHFQNKLDEFKESSTINILLLPLSVGSNGLNIIEATNVLLVEPILDNSKVLQAIGRVHRIGQTKKTFVHKFVIESTIEENIHEVHNVDSSSGQNGKHLTVNDLKLLFDKI